MLEREQLVTYFKQFGYKNAALQVPNEFLIQVSDKRRKKPFGIDIEFDRNSS